MKNLKLISIIIISSMLIIFAVDAAGRKGSKRVGGTNSKGKGSHYVGGKKKSK
ncbi:hypothetical protein LPTSP3_g31780 [Leptospira kobayashii]|uniref:Uncharacterized protein n=1 Tax=Leptospira kobayashii TaxID=1917830 RepID=A0ABM7USL8_9LEPT|nr:hypothetical protein [Leptospira kobayashii]BDA80187.1 hypothetical protein LPTSP3_g31170 [Leptospira kobayashii]BDA80248.1 hypothetical protein LPTSP3_g31780 [Leptospira kobayashii]